MIELNRLLHKLNKLLCILLLILLIHILHVVHSSWELWVLVPIADALVEHVMLQQEIVCCPERSDFNPNTNDSSDQLNLKGLTKLSFS